MHKIYTTAAIVFSSLLGLIIYAEDTGGAIPATELVRSFNHGDKVAHFLLFGALSFLLNLAFIGKCFNWGCVSVYRGTAIVAVFATLEECSQYFIPTRTFDYFDLLADFSGLLIFGIATACLLKNNQLKTSMTCAVR